MKTSSYLLVIDQGTTSTRAMLFDETAQVISKAQQEIQQYYPKPAWVEHSPQEIWDTVVKVCREVLATSKIATEQVIGLGITNQRETTILWDRKTGCAIHPAIVWQDRRNSAYCERLKAKGMEEMVSKKTGLRLDPYFSAIKIAWILQNVSGARDKALRGELAFGTIDSYLLWQLTAGGQHATDITNAARTLLFNIHTRQWDEELLTLFDIPFSLLPEVKPNTAFYGETSASLFGRALPIVAMIGDQQAAAVGQACFTKGMIKSTYGTGCFMLLNTGSDVISSKHQLLATVAYQIGTQYAYALEGSIFMAGATLQWLRDAMKLIQSAKDSEALVASLKDTGGVYLVPAFTGLGAPYWDPNARGAIVGLTRDSGIPQIVRAALEAVCYQTRDLMQAMQEDGISITELRVDGGMTANQWLMQFLADMLQIPITRSAWVETTALGVAYLIGVQQGLYEHSPTSNALWQADKQFAPMMSSVEQETLYQGWLHAVNMICSDTKTKPDVKASGNLERRS